MRRVSENQNDPHRYDDILNRKHPVSKNHPPMSLLERAAQFKPFAALEGYDESIEEAARITEKRHVLSEEEKEELDHEFVILKEREDEHPVLAVRWFEEDHLKNGGKYVLKKGRMKKINLSEGKMIFLDGSVIRLDQIDEIQSDIFRDESAGM